VCALSFPSFSVCTELSFPSLLTVARAQSEEDAATAEVAEGADLGIVGDDTQVSSDEPLSPAPGVETLCVFPKNAGKSEYISKYLYVIYVIVHHVSVNLSLTINSKLNKFIAYQIQFRAYPQHAGSL
jgi:hypothetical protein